jgi:hypothetical protein
LGNNGPTPKEGQAAKKYDDLKKGLVGSMLNGGVEMSITKNCRGRNKIRDFNFVLM